MVMTAKLHKIGSKTKLNGVIKIIRNQNLFYVQYNLVNFLFYVV